MREVDLIRAYDWLDTEEQFMRKCSGVVQKTEGRILNRVYAVFDKSENEWFLDAPMLAEIDGSFIFVNVSNCRYTTVGVDEFFPDDKPIWFRRNCAPDGWSENLEWRVFDDISKCFGQRVNKILPITAAIYEELFSVRGNGLNGIVLELEKGKLIIHDNGDQICAQYIKYNCFRWSEF